MTTPNHDAPVFETWSFADLVKWASQAYPLLQKKHKEVEQLKLANEQLQRTLGHFNNRDDWK